MITISQLIEHLKTLNPNALVICATQYQGDTLTTIKLDKIKEVNGLLTKDGDFHNYGLKNSEDYNDCVADLVEMGMDFIDKTVVEFLPYKLKFSDEDWESIQRGLRPLLCKN